MVMTGGSDVPILMVLMGISGGEVGAGAGEM